MQNVDHYETENKCAASKFSLITRSLPRTTPTVRFDSGVYEFSDQTDLGIGINQPLLTDYTMSFGSMVLCSPVGCLPNLESACANLLARAIVTEKGD